MRKTITEDRMSDISTVYGYLVTPTEKYPNGTWKFCKSWSCFNGDYKVGYERSFIAEMEAELPGIFESFHIGWSDCN